MAHLWLMDAKRAWVVFPLAEPGYGVDRLPPSVIESVADASRCIALLPAGASPGVSWVLMAPMGAKAQVNGWPLRIGMRVLDDHDEVEIAGVGTFFFSTESLARIEPLPEMERAITCVRCKLPIELESPAVRCPNCRVWHHQGGEYECWTYSEGCAACSFSTRLDDRYRWTPEEAWA